MDKWKLLLAVLLVILEQTIARKHGPGHHHDDDDDDDDDDHDDKEKAHEVFWAGVGGIVIICVVSVLGAAIFSLCAWVVCALHTKCRKDRVRNAPGVQMMTGQHSTYPPEWTRRLVNMPELGLSKGFSQVSDGFYTMTNFHLLRQRAGMAVTDGAKWAVPLTSGQHLFEIIWPWGSRGKHATVGLGTAQAPIRGKGGINLVGGNPHSWGLDIIRRQVLNKGRVVARCPTDGSYVPDRFLMYIDMDQGTLGFGCDVTFWGNVVTDLPINGQKPLYVMVGADKWQAQIQVYYRASAVSDGTNPYTGGNAFVLPPLPPMTNPPMPPCYANAIAQPGSSGNNNNIFSIFNAATTTNKGDNNIDNQDDWLPEPPPTPTAPDSQSIYDPPPPYASPRPDH